MLVAFLHCHRRSSSWGCRPPRSSAARARASRRRRPPKRRRLSIEMLPAELHEGQAAALVVRSAGADSIVVESESGIDRYWSHGSELRATITPDFGDAVPVMRYAGEYQGRRLDLLRKRARIVACRRGRCTEYVHEIPVRLPERNRRSVALSAGYSSVFARRSILGADRTVLFKEVLTSGVWAAAGRVGRRRLERAGPGFRRWRRARRVTRCSANAQGRWRGAVLRNRRARGDGA